MNGITCLNRRQRGIGLVEIMVALVIGLILLAGLFQIFQSNRTSHRISEALARVQENGRFAMMFLSRDLRMAGHIGCTRDFGLRNTLGSSNYLYDFETYLVGHRDENGTGNWQPALPSGLSNVVKGTDVVTVRAADGNTILIDPMNSATDNVVPRTVHDLAVGDTVVLSDCEMAAAFRINQIDGAGALVHGQNLGKAYRGDAELMRIATTTYFIRENVAGKPALWRRIGNNPAEELVEGVDDLFVLYGIDTNADGAADEYKPADEVVSWDDVVSLQVTLRVRSREDNVTAEPDTVSYDGAQVTDRRLRQTFTSTISIRNRLK